MATKRTFECWYWKELALDSESDEYSKVSDEKDDEQGEQEQKAQLGTSAGGDSNW
jgi:hypothetical protein